MRQSGNALVAVDFARIAGSEMLWWCGGCSNGLVFLGGGVVGVLDGEGSMGEGGQGHNRHRGGWAVECGTMTWLVSLSFTEM